MCRSRGHASTEPSEARALAARRAEEVARRTDARGFRTQTVNRFPIERQRALERVSGVQTFRKVVMNPMPGSAPVPGA